MDEAVVEQQSWKEIDTRTDISQFVYLQPLPSQILIFPPCSPSPGAQCLFGGITTVTNLRSMMPMMKRETDRRVENTSKETKLMST